MTPKNQDALEDKINQIRNEYGAHQSSIMGCGYLAEICEAARRYAAIREAVEKGTHALVPVKQTDAMLEAVYDTKLHSGNHEAWLDLNCERLAIEWQAMLRAHGIDPLIDNQGEE